MQTIDTPAEGVACGVCKYYTIDFLGLHSVSGTCAKICIPVEREDWCNNPCHFEEAKLPNSEDKPNG